MNNEQFNTETHRKNASVKLAYFIPSQCVKVFVDRSRRPEDLCSASALGDTEWSPICGNSVTTGEDM
jgi:hypothetical protein